MLTFSLGVACGAKRFEYFTSKISFLVFLRSRDVENRLFRLQIIQNEIFNVFEVSGRWKSFFSSKNDSD